MLAGAAWLVLCALPSASDGALPAREGRDASGASMLRAATAESGGAPAIVPAPRRSEPVEAAGRAVGAADGAASDTGGSAQSARTGAQTATGMPASGEAELGDGDEDGAGDGDGDISAWPGGADDAAGAQAERLYVSYGTPPGTGSGSDAWNGAGSHGGGAHHGHHHGTHGAGTAGEGARTDARAEGAGPEVGNPPEWITDLVLPDPEGPREDGASAAAADYPGTLINRTDVTERYSSDDTWEVWICDVTNSNISYTLDEALDLLNGQVKEYFAWLSDGQYDISFVPGGVLRSKHAWNPSSGSSFQHPDCGGFSDLRWWNDRDGIPVIARYDDVSSNGVFVAFNNSQFVRPYGAIIGLFSYDHCSSANCNVTFPANQRRVYVDGAVLSPDTLFGAPQLGTAAHELGHALTWPHSYLGWDKAGSTGQYHNFLDIMSHSHWAIGTPVVNRVAAGWVDDAEIVRHLSTTGAATYTLVPPGRTGTQMLVLPGANATEYHAFGARVRQRWDNVRPWDPYFDRFTDASGVEGYYIDQTCSSIDGQNECNGTGETWGLGRRIEPIFRDSTDDDPVSVYTGQSLPVGRAVGPSDEHGLKGSLRLEVIDRQGDAFTVWVGGHEAPKRPLDVRVTRDSGSQATVTWAPAPWPSIFAWGFEVQYRSGTAAYRQPKSGSGTCAGVLSWQTRSCTITGLTAGSAYDVRVRARSRQPSGTDWGPWTAVGGSVLNAEVAPGDAELVVRWDPPAAGASYTNTENYVEIGAAGAYAKPSAGTCAQAIPAATTRCTITGLANGSAYSVRIAALDSSGSGIWTPATAASATATPVASLPAAPAAPTLSASGATLTVSWPAAAGTVTGHAVSYRTGSDAFAAPGAGTCSGTIAATATSCTITGLANGTGYEVRRRLIASAGSGPWSPTASGVPRGQPAAPTGVTVSAAHQALEAAWDAPSSADAPPSASARVEYGVGTSPSSWTLGCAVDDIAVQTCRIASLVNGTAYSVRVRFSNGTDSAWTTATGTPVATVPLRMPRPEAWATSDSGLTVRWTAPAGDETGGSAVTGYRLEHRPYSTSAADPWETHTVAGALTSLLIDGLKPYRLYQVRVRAVNALGAGAWSAAATGYISPTDPPAAPRSATATTHGSSLDIAWSRPADDSVLFYEIHIEIRKDANSDWVGLPYVGSCARPGRDVTSCSVTSVPSRLRDWKWRVRVLSRNHYYAGASADWVLATTASAGATPSFGASTVASQTWTAGTANDPLTLPPAAGGTGALTYSISPALPAGLSFSATTRQITGRPAAAAASAAYTYTVTDSATPTANTATLTFTVEVEADSAPTLAAVTAAEMQLYSSAAAVTLPAAGAGTGNGALAYTLTGTLPAGLSFDASTRQITGTPTERGATSLALTVRDADGDSATAPFVVTVGEPVQHVSYPSRLVSQTDRVRRYSAPAAGQDHVADTWEVWVCDVPNGSQTLTPAGVAAFLNAKMTPYWRWLSGDKYRPAFVAGGTQVSTQNWTPSSASAMEHPGCGGAATAGTPFTQRTGIPTRAASDSVSSNGMVVVFDRDLSSATPAFTEGLFLGQRCPLTSAVGSCSTSFPANERRIHLDAGVVAADGSGNPTARLRMLAHELGRALEFPHAYSGESTADPHGNLSDIMSGGAFPTATGVLNRYAAGWVADSAVVKHLAGTGSATYELASLGTAGIQMLTLPGRDEAEFYALGARTISAYDKLDVGKEGVEAVRVDQDRVRADAAVDCWTDAGANEHCFGRDRRHETLTEDSSADRSYGHIYGVGASGTAGELRFEVVHRSGGAYTVWVGDNDAPATPEDVRVTRDSGTQIGVAWNAPTGGTTPTGFTVQIRAGTAAFAAPSAGTCKPAQGAAARSCTITGLTSGTGYDVRVRASSADGAGPWAMVGGPVQNFEAAAGPAMIAVSWDPTTGGVNYTTAYYRVQIRTGANAFATPAAGTCATTTLAATSLACTITGLTDGTAYDVRMVAMDRYGAGSWSATVSATPKAALPAAPAAPSLTAGNQQITVSWTAATQGSRSLTEGAQPATVTGYAVQYRTGASAFAAPTSGTCASALTAAATSCTIAGLTNRTTYEVRLRAATSSGSGPWSPKTAGKALDTPDAPAAPTVAQASRSSATVTWTAPSDSGQAITNYQLRHRRKTSNNIAAWASHSDTGATLSRTVSGLTPYVAYEFQVSAKNTHGYGPWSPAAEARTQATAVPGAPTAVAVTQTVADLTVAWAAPADSDVQTYTVSLQRRDSTTDSWAAQAFAGACTTLSTADVSCKITSYANSDSFDPTKHHRAAVAATNHLGSSTSAWSSAGAVFSLPSAPQVSDIVHVHSTQSRFAASVLDKGNPALTRWEMRYRVVPDVGAPAAWSTVDWNQSTDTAEAVVFELRNTAANRRHDVQVRAVNAVGEGPTTEFSFWAGLPTKPTLTVQPGSGRLTLSAVTALGGGAGIAKWQYVQWTGSTEPDRTGQNAWKDITQTGLTLSHVVEGLSNGTEYKFRVRAVSTAGSGVLASTGIESDMVAATPAAPQIPPVASDDSTGGNGSTGNGGGGGGGGGGAKPLRLSDSTRYGTAKAVGDQLVELLETVNPASNGRVDVSTVIVASGRAFPDALTASALSRVLAAPVLLTDPKRLDSAVTAFVNKHRISQVVIVGGKAAVSEEVETALEALSEVREVVRHFGPDRYSTAAKVAAEVGAPGLLCRSTKRTVILTTGRNYPDALVAGPLAYRGAHPILLTELDRLPAPIAEYLSASTAQHAIVIGGRSAVGDAVVEAVKALGLTVQRISGSDRADTSVKVARFLTGRAGTGSCFRTDSVGLATGWAFPDALAAAPLLGQYGAPLLLTSPGGVPQSLLDYAASGRLRRDFDLPPVVTIGGTSAVPARHPTQLLASLPRG